MEFIEEAKEFFETPRFSTLTVVPRRHFAWTFSIYFSFRNSLVVFVDSLYEFHSLYTYDSQNIRWKFHHFNEQI